MFRDRCLLTALCFYLPSPLAAAWLFVAAICALWKRAYTFCAVWAVMLAVVLMVVALVENHWFRPPVSPADARSIRAVHWNIWYGKLGWRGVLTRMAEAQADVYVLSEWWPPSDPAEVAAALGPEFSAKEVFNVAIIARGTLGTAHCLPMKRGMVCIVPWRFQGRTLRLMAVDLPSNPLAARAPLLHALEDHITQFHPHLVLGDFNVPRRSCAFDVLPEGYAHAYNDAGAGWSYTWPSPLPVLAIDQCFTGPGIEALRYRIDATLISDHCMQVLDFVATP